MSLRRKTPIKKDFKIKNTLEAENKSEQIKDKPSDTGQWKVITTSWVTKKSPWKFTERINDDSKNDVKTNLKKDQIIKQENW